MIVRVAYTNWKYRNYDTHLKSSYLPAFFIYKKYTPPFLSVIIFLTILNNL
jgi:hypothetical protein